MSSTSRILRRRWTAVSSPIQERQRGHVSTCRSTVAVATPGSSPSSRADNASRKWSHPMARWSPDPLPQFPTGQTPAMDDLTRLALSAAAGDRVATGELVRRTQAEVWRVCARLGDRAASDDLTQEVYLRALPALSRFRGDSSVRTWLLQITRHVCADHVRRATRQRALAERLGRRGDRSDVVVAPRTGEVELDTAIAALDSDRRAAFVLTQVVGLSYAEAAEVCDVPIGTIRSRVARARDDLLGALAVDDGTATG